MQSILHILLLLSFLLCLHVRLQLNVGSFRPRSDAHLKHRHLWHEKVLYSALSGLFCTEKHVSYAREAFVHFLRCVQTKMSAAQLVIPVSV